MDLKDREAITGLFDKLAEVEGARPPRDPEAEAFIGAAMARLPGAAYAMAQTIIVQDQALHAAKARIATLEAELAAAQRDSAGGGFLAGLFGDDPAPPARAAAGPAPAARPLPQGAPVGFLAGAAQTAVAVAGGVLAANAILGLLAPEAEAGATAPDLDPEQGDGGFGGDDGW